ncbi:urease accessory protein UreE [Desulfolithobacter sp.]
MICLTRKTDSDPGGKALTLTLPWEKRIKSRLRVQLDNGLEAGLFLPRGTVLRGGDLLVDDSAACVVRILAADEEVSRVLCHDGLQLARACYHLGNRHVALQIDRQWVQYLHDHVLDAMVRGLGLAVTRELAPFEPEHGAYASGGHGHHHA